MRVFYSNEISKPPEVVFPWIADPEKAMQWQRNVQGGEILIDRPEIIGTTFIETIEEDGNTLEMRGEITEYRENQVIGFHLQSKIHEFDISYTVEEAEKGTRLSIVATIRWKFPMNLIALFTGKRIESGIKDQLASEVLELKGLCEGE
jgi:hypothetical protein